MYIKCIKFTCTCTCSSTIFTCTRIIPVAELSQQETEASPLLLPQEDCSIAPNDTEQEQPLNMDLTEHLGCLRVYLKKKESEKLSLYSKSTGTHMLYFSMGRTKLTLSREDR